MLKMLVFRNVPIRIAIPQNWLLQLVRERAVSKSVMPYCYVGYVAIEASKYAESSLQSIG